MRESAAAFEIDSEDGVLRLVAKGDWRARFLGPLDGGLRDFADDSTGRDLIIDVSGVECLDTAGAMVIQRTLLTCEGRGEKSGIVGASAVHASLLEQVRPHLDPCLIEPAHPNAFLMMLNRLGRGAVDAYYAALELLSFIGFTLSKAFGVLTRPRRLRMTSIVHHMEEAGLDAVLIVGLMSFLIGAVVAFMGAKILRQFNAEIFTVELVGISVLREFGVLLAAILIAGRSGSAFTAQIGSMKIREEIDALQTLGLDPMEVLVLPRVIALVVVLPILAFLAAMLGMIGGGLVAWMSMDISPALFLSRTKETIAMSNFWVGLIKAPFFAFVIGVIGCFQGMEVEGSAESLGQRTTLSVVQALFLVIVIDAFFAMFFLELDF
ncbi:MAG: MlaE family ABC transporter permease [Parvularculaceae bacterium]